MDETEGLCVQSQTVQGAARRSIASVAGYRMSEIFHVDAYLVLAAGIELDFHQ